MGAHLSKIIWVAAASSILAKVGSNPLENGLATIQKREAADNLPSLIPHPRDLMLNFENIPQSLGKGDNHSRKRRAEGRDIASEVKRIIKEQLDVAESDITLDASIIEDLGADSLGWVELILAFEEAFEIDIPDEDAEKLKTVRDFIEYIKIHTAH